VRKVRKIGKVGKVGKVGKLEKRLSWFELKDGDEYVERSSPGMTLYILKYNEIFFLKPLSFELSVSAVLSQHATLLPAK
jgi:hypothetical protein